VATTTILRMLARKRSLTDNCRTQCVAVTLLSHVYATSSVSVISGTPDNAAVAVSEVSGRTQTIAGRWTDLTSSLIGRTRSLQPKRPARSLPTRGFVDCCGGCTGIPFHLTYTDVPVGAWFMARFLDLLLALAAQRRLTSRAAVQAASSRAAYAAFMLQVSVLLSLEIATRPFPWPPLVKRCWWDACERRLH
jgi:hypothetical protein